MVPLGVTNMILFATKKRNNNSWTPGPEIINVQAICFPSGQYNQTTLQLLPKLEYRFSFTTHSGKVHFGGNPMITQTGPYFWRYPNRLFSKNVSII
jgi:hypothetical protein